MVAFEKDKIGGAIRTDFILSAEIIVISLGTLVGRTFVEQLLTLVAIALIMTIGVYGLVAGIVKLDDAGLALKRGDGGDGWARFKRSVGAGILHSAPYLMKFLSIAGTAAMFLVGGGILVHAVAPLHHFIEPYTHGTAGTLASMLFNAAIGILAGAIVLLVVKLVSRLRKSATLPGG
jgi:predicted DNA repair protein MutK